MMSEERNCGTCYRDEDDGVVLVNVIHEEDLWCRECINDFSIYNIQEATKVTRGELPTPKRALIIRFPINDVVEV